MNVRERQHEILEYIMERGAVQVDDLVDSFGVSRMTVHRDLDALAREGMVRKVRGGATIENSSGFESDFRYRAKLAVKEKTAIAAAAARLIEPGQVIGIGFGTTVAGLVDLLADRLPLTVITNNIGVVERLSTVRDIQLIVPGGAYSRRFHGLFGLVAEQSLASLHCDLVFMSTSSVKGLTAYHQDQDVVKTKRALLASADRRVLMLDHTKFEKTALHTLCGLDEFEVVLTGRPPPAAAIEAMDSQGIDWRAVGTVPDGQHPD